MSESVEFWQELARDHLEAFVEAEVANETLRKALRLIAEAPFGAEVHELREVAAAALSKAPTP